MNNNIGNIIHVNIDQEHKEITALKKLITQLQSITLRNKDLLSIKDKTTLEKTPQALEQIIKKKSTLIKKRQTYDKKLTKITAALKNEFEKLDDTKKLSCILLQNLNTFTLGTNSFNEGVQEFLQVASKEIYQKDITAFEYIKNLQNLLNNENPNYQKYLDTYNQKLAQFGL